MRMVSFSVHLSSSALLQITLVEPTGKPLFHFATRAGRGRTQFTELVPALDLRRNSHLRLKIVVISHGKKRTVSVPLKP